MIGTQAFVLLAIIAATPPLNAPLVDICELFKHPPEHRGQLVQVTGTARLGFESFLLVGECRERVTRESLFDRICIKMSGAGPAATVSRVGGASSDDVVAVAEVPEDEFIDKVLNDGYEKAVNSLLWEPLEYAPAEAKKDDLWQKFLDVIREQSTLNVSLVGRFEYVDTRSMIRFRDGGVGALNGYGHMNSCRARLVVTQVLSFATAEQ